jgi:hypothetical protein
MPSYEFRAVTSGGEFVRDVVQAPSDEEAIQQTRLRGLFVTEISEVSPSGDRRAVVSGPLTPGARAGVVRHWAQFVAVGLALVLVLLVGSAVAGELSGWQPVLTFLGGAAALVVTVWVLARWSDRVLRRRVESARKG